MSKINKTKKEYYDYEVGKVLPVDEYGIQIKIKSNSEESKWLRLNRFSLKSIDNFLKKINSN